MKRRTAREKALQALFQIDVGGAETTEAYEYILDTEEDNDFLKSLIFGTMEHKEEIDELITEHLENWKLERLANVDRNLLRLTVYEMKYLDDIPLSVSIDEAVEIAKIYGDDRSSRFINGVLSKIKLSLEN